MHYAKRVIAEMPKAYAVAEFDGPEGQSFLVATEKEGPIRRFTPEGESLETVAPGPGGVMTITQVPGRDDQFLATYKFFSPNFGADEAKIVSYTRASDGTWAESTLCDLPYVHRFGLLKAADGRVWIIACTIKSGCRTFKNDWLTPGAVYVAPLDGACEKHSDADQLKLTVLSNCQLQNHGFWVAPDRSFALVSTAAGVFRYVPPAAEGEDWQVSCLIVHPTSDICMVDFDGDGKDEILTFSAFHGDTLSVWHEGENPDTYTCVWTDPQKRDFLHAIWSGELGGQKCAVIGNRKADRDLLRVYYADGEYRLEVVDHDRGPANCTVVTAADGTQRIVAANRETDEVALYTVSE